MGGGAGVVREKENHYSRGSRESHDVGKQGDSDLF